MTNRRASREGDEGRCRPRWSGVPRRFSTTGLLDAVVLIVTAGCGNGVKPTATTTAADSADQVLHGMSHNLTIEGLLRAKVRADTAFIYNATQTSELRNVHITFYDAHGAQTSTLTAHEGTFHMRTNDMEGRGNVVIVTTDGRTLRTEVMRYNQARDEVTSDRPFMFDAPGRHIEGDGFVSDPDFKDVRARKPRGTGGQFTLPNQ